MKEKTISINHMTKDVYDCLRRQKELDFRMRNKVKDSIDGYSNFVFLSTTGMSFKAVQYIMGHEDIQTTLDIYTHANLDLIKKEMWERK